MLTSKSGISYWCPSGYSLVFHFKGKIFNFRRAGINTKPLLIYFASKTNKKMSMQKLCEKALKNPKRIFKIGKILTEYDEAIKCDLKNRLKRMGVI